MTIRELINQYVEACDVKVTGEPDNWTVDTWEVTVEGLTDWELETAATTAINRFEELEA